MAEEDVAGGVDAASEPHDGTGADEFLAPGFAEVETDEVPPEPAPNPQASPQPVDSQSLPPLPPDIEEVWGGGKVDATGQPAINTARVLIDGWGLDGFRNSAIHIAAIKETQRDGKMEVIRAAFIKAKKQKT